MEVKKVLGLDIGTNSIGAAIINIPKYINDFGKDGEIEWLGSRIIPVDGDYLQKFESGGQAETKAAARRMKRGSRRLKHRYKLRRTRLIQVFKILGWINENFPLDDSKEFKKQININPDYKIRISDYLPFNEKTIEEATELLGVKGKRNKHGNIVIPEDWIIYYLRKKALSEKITLFELTRVIYMLNQRRGFKSGRKDLKETTILSYDDFKKNKEDIDAGKLSDYRNGHGEELETKFVSIAKIKSVEQDSSEEKDNKGNFTFIITADDKRLEPWKEKRKKKPEWLDKEFSLVVTQKIDKKGKFTQNKPQIPKEDDWELSMVALDNQIGEKTPGLFFWDKLVEDKNYKIRQIAIRREKYQKELETIWNKQLELRKAEYTEQELLNDDKLEKISTTLYKHNLAKQKELKEKGLLHIISNDIIYYQRELKSQKNSVGECQYERHKGVDGEIYGVKSAPKSSPEFQEFRIWQDIHNIRILEKEQKVNEITKIDVDVTRQFIDTKAKEKLFELFDKSKEISEQMIFNELNKHNPEIKLKPETYRVNLFSNRDKLPGNETKELFKKIFRKFNYETEGEKLLADKDTLRKLWHINYSISSSDLGKSAKGIASALGYDLKWGRNSNWEKFRLPIETVEAFTKLSDIKKQYASYSTKALNKLLPIMRCGRYWDWNKIHNETRERIEKIIKEGWDFAYEKRTGELIKEREFVKKEQFSGLPVWMACYVVYARHSERESDKKFEKPEELDVMKLIPNNSLRNPIVEQVIRETLFLVKDIWKQYGQPDEIHIELGRELKKNSVEKERITKNNLKNLEEKKRIKKLLYELLNGSFEHYNDNGEIVTAPFEVKPNPENPTDIEKFRIYKSCGDITNDEEKANWDVLFKEGKKERIPISAEIKKYTLWLSQKCISPYTGKTISLGKLFTEEYEVEHIIPRKKLKYDAFENLVICERGVNKLKGNELAMVFISKHNGVELGYEGKKYKLQTIDAYISHCKKTFKGRKLKNLLATDVPEDFIERQINDTRYITRKVSELLYPIAKDQEGLIFTIGSITNDLKREWGLNTIWKEIIKPRFERLEKITGQQMIVPDEEDANKFHFNVLNQPDFNEKRIDHRHHAMDALIIAATTREHIRYLNSLNAVDNSQELQQVKRALVKGGIRDYKLPWENFTKNAKEKLNETIVTFKSNNKIVSKPSNKYVSWKQREDGSWEKNDKCYQKPNKKWMAVRKSMFKEPQGIIWIKEKREVPVLDAFKVQIERMKVEHDKEKRKTATYVYDQLARLVIKDIIEKAGINLNDTDILLEEIDKYLKKNSKKVETGKIKKNGKPNYKTLYLLGGYEYERIWIAQFNPYASKRTSLSKKEYTEKLTEEKINKDFPYPETNRIAQLMITHLKEYNNNPKEAFSAEGLEILNKKAITDSNIGKPIKTITRIETKSDDDKFGNKYVEVDKGAVAYFIIYEHEETKERPEMYSLSTHKAIERLVEGKPLADRKAGYNTIILSPDELVYIPTEDELKKIKANEPNPINWNDKKAIFERIYKMVSSSKKQCFFIPNSIAKPLDENGEELGANNKAEKSWDGIMIKQVCIKIEINRLGNIQPVQ